MTSPHPSSPRSLAPPACPLLSSIAPSPFPPQDLGTCPLSVIAQRASPSPRLTRRLLREAFPGRQPPSAHPQALSVTTRVIFLSTPAPAWSPLVCKAARRCGLRLALPGPPPCSQHRQHCAERSRCSADWRPQEGVRCRAPSRSGEVSLLLHSDLRLRPTHVREVSQLHSKATDFNTNLNRKHHHRTSRIMSDRISGHRDPDQLTRTLTITDAEQDKPKGIPAPDT